MFHSNINVKLTDIGSPRASRVLILSDIFVRVSLKVLPYHIQ